MLRHIRNRTFSGTRRFASDVGNTVQELNLSTVPADARIFSMVQPTGLFHLGNYLGATKVWKDMCNSKQAKQTLLFGVADLHAITIPKPDVKQFYEYRLDAVASILSLGIDPSKAIIFHQSQIPAHSQLFWLLSTLSPMGYLNRMTQWKSKSEGQAEFDVKLGLFAYPILQTADILLYKSTHVPVGEDQRQHLELTRFIANQFNSLYKVNYFPKPVTLFANTKKVLSLGTPEKKMSKSDPQKMSTIYLNDEPDVIRKKIRKSLTDSISDRFYYDPENRPGVSNLIIILSGIQGKSITEIESDIAKFTTYRDFKEYVSDIIIEDLKEPRLEFNRLTGNKEYLVDVIRKGSEDASVIANQNLKEIMEIMGFHI